MNQFSRALLIFLFFCDLLSCSKKPTDYRSFLNGSEIVYPGSVSSISEYPGNGRIQLGWSPSPDPSVSKYVVYWNNYADSLVIPASQHNPSDTIKCVITGLQEYIYTFFINSYDAAGNKSISTELDNVRVYGPIYQGNLHNRPVNTDSPYVFPGSQPDVTLKFLPPDSINITTIIKYTNNAGTTQQAQLSPDSSSVTLFDYKPGTTVFYQSAYIPQRGAIDTFYTATADTFPTIIRYIQCDKSRFVGLSLPNDMVAAYGTTLAQLWDGATSPKSFPNIYHTDGATPLPQHFSFDMGAVYNNLGRVQEIGRDCCHNPVDFEVWGIADTTGAITNLPGNDPGWKNEAISKGWTLLREVIRPDDGIAPFTSDLNANPPPVRFVMVRVIKTADDPNAVNLSQITFWYKQ